MTSRSRKQYYVRTRNRLLGPVSLQQLELMERRGELNASDEISEDRVNWGPLAGLEELFPSPPKDEPAPESVTQPRPQKLAAGPPPGRPQPSTPPRRPFRQRVRPVLPPPVGPGGADSGTDVPRRQASTKHAVAVVAVVGCLMLAIGFVAASSVGDVQGRDSGTGTQTTFGTSSTTTLSSYTRNEGGEIIVGISSDSLDAIRQEQVGRNWCWAACIQMVLKAHGFDRSQTEIVQRTFGDTRDTGAGVAEIKNNLEGWSLRRAGQPYVLNCEVTIGPPSLGYMIEQLKLARPLIIAYRHPGGAHAVVVTAVKYRRDVDGVPQLTEIVVRDPGRFDSTTRGRRSFPREEYLNCEYSFYVVPIQ
jgi:hypothetical protein